MEKKKLLLVAISVGVFLALTIGAAILVFTPKISTLPFETTTGNINPETISYFPQASYQYPTTGIEQQSSSSIDAVDLVRNPGGVPGLVAPPEGVNSQVNSTGRGTENVITVPQPTTAAVPNTAPTGRAVNQSTPTAAARPAQTTTTPSQTTTSGSQTTSTPAQTNTGTSRTASTPAQTTAGPSQTASTPAQTTASPSQTASSPAQTASTQVQTIPAQTTPAAATGSQLIPAAQTSVYNNYWVQTGAFSTMALAEAVTETLASKGITSIIENGDINGRTLFRVRVGPYTSQNEANYWLALIKSIDGFEDSQVRQSENLR